MRNYKVELNSYEINDRNGIDHTSIYQKHVSEETFNKIYKLITE